MNPVYVAIFQCHLNNEFSQGNLSFLFLKRKEKKEKTSGFPFPSTISFSFHSQWSLYSCLTSDRKTASVRELSGKSYLMSWSFRKHE